MNRIAQFKAGVWHDSGTLMEGRYSHGAISNGIETMIIGGVSVRIEVWKISDGPKMHEYKTINETILENGDYLNPTLFTVPLEYAQLCKHGPDFLAITLSWSLALFLGLYLILCFIKCSQKDPTVGPSKTSD